MKAAFLSLSLLIAAPAFADSQAIPKGATLTAAQAGHAYAAACHTGQPALMKSKVSLWEDAFGFVPATDADHEIAFASADGGIAVVADYGALKAMCKMTVSSEIAGDGADLYDSLEAHFAERWWRDSPVVADYTDGGLVWTYTRQDVAHSITYVETDAGFIVTHLAERE